MEKDIKKEILIARKVHPVGLAGKDVVYRQRSADGTKAGSWVITSGLLAIDYRIGVPSHATVNSYLPYHHSEVKLQTKYTFGDLQTVFESAGLTLNNAVQMTCFMKPGCLNQGSTQGTLQDYLEEKKNWLKHPYPVSTYITIKDLFPRGPLLEISMVGFTNEVQKEIIKLDPNRVPTPPNEEPLAIKAGPWVFLSGFGPTDWKNPVAPEVQRNPAFGFGSDVQLQADYTLKRMKTVLEEAGSSLENVVRASVYLSTARDLYILDEVWKKYFPNKPPARLVIPVDGFPICPSWKVQIDMIGITKGSAIRKEIVEGDDIPRPLSHESAAVKAGSMLFISGQMAGDENGLVQEARMHKDFPYAERSIKRQTAYIIKKIQKICEAAGTSIENVLMRQAFFTNFPEDLAPAWEVLETAFPKGTVAGVGIGITGPLIIPSCDLIVEAWAFVPQR